MTDDKQRIEQNIGIGAQLRAAREGKKISLADISSKLHIREDHLLALEEENFTKLPGDVYVTGFIRTYAGHLDLNGAEMVSRLKAAQQVDSANEAAANESESEPISAALKIGLGVVCVMAFFIMWLIAGLDMSGQTDAPIDSEAIAPAVNNNLPPIIKEPPIAAPVAKAPPVARVPAAPAAPQAARVARPPAPRATEVPRAVKVAPPPVAAAPAVLPKIEIRATRRTWMRLENAEGQILFSSVINVGRRVELRDEGTYFLATRDAGGLEFLIDGEVLGAVGRRRQILTSLRLTRQDILAKKF